MVNLHRGLLAGVATLALAIAATACESSGARRAPSGSSADPDPSTAATTPSRAGRARAPRATAAAPACGWIPEDAREATAVASLHGDRAEDPLCVEPASALDIPREVAASIEKELREATKMSDEDEARIGAQLEAALPREPEFAGRFDLPEDVKRYGGYLRSIVQNLATKTTRPGLKYRVHLVRKPEFNAAALPGGVIVVFTGTLEGREAVRDEAELAGVLGHEMTHIERRHVVAAYQFARAALGNDGDAAILAMHVLMQPLATEYELEADDRGMEIATLAGYDPQAVVNLWMRKIRSEPRRSGGRRGRRGVLGEVLEDVDALLRSHPPASVRACHAMAKVAWAREHAPCDRLYDGRTNLLTHVAGPRRPY
jgi:predicted Zn-dependent protease